MKIKSITGVLFSLFLCSASFGSEVIARFDSSTGKIIIPHFEVDGVIYFVTLSLADPEAFTFSLDLETIQDLSPPEEVPVNSDSSAILGTWTVAEVGQENLTITFNEDGTYSHFEQDNEDCSNGGGREEGSYNWEPSTGLLQLVNLTLDENGECGLSHPRFGIPLRLFVDGNTATVLERAEGGGTLSFEFVRVSNQS